MPLPILIPNISPALYGTYEVNSVNWKLDPGSLYFPFLMGANGITPFTHKITFPAYNLLPEYSGFTEWKLEIILNGKVSLPVMKVNGESSYSGPLGSVAEDPLFWENYPIFSFENLNLLFAGTYLFEVNFKVSAIPPIDALRPSFVPFREVISAKNMPILLDVFTDFASPPLYLSLPNLEQGLSFSHVLGGPLPLEQNFAFFPAVELEIATGDGILNISQELISENHGILTVSLSDIESFVVGQYDYSFTVSNGLTEVNVPVKLYVVESTSGGFSINPTVAQMTVVAGAAVSNMSIINIESTGAWKLISSIPIWLNISVYSGTGNQMLFVTPGDLNGLEAGSYRFPLVFESFGEKIAVDFTLNLITFLSSPFVPGNLYFTKELDFMNFSTSKINTYIEVTLVLKVFKINTNVSTTYTRVFDLPIYKGKADFHPGTVVHQLLDDIENLVDFVPNFELNYHKPQIQPALVSISYIEKVYAGEVENPALDYYSGNLQTFRMIKGNKPYMTDSQLSLLTVSQQELIRITPNSVLGISFSFPGTPKLLVKKNNRIIDDVEIQSFSSGDNIKMIYSYFRFANDFKPGDIIEMMISSGLETRSRRYLVFQNGLESTYIFFENENNQIEPFEFSGRRRITSTTKHILGSKFKKLKGFDTKIDSEDGQMVILNTGQLGKSEHIIVNSIIRSLNVWMSFDSPAGPYLKVDATSTKIITQDTSISEEDFDIEFNILPE